MVGGGKWRESKLAGAQGKRTSGAVTAKRRDFILHWTSFQFTLYCVTVEKDWRETKRRGWGRGDPNKIPSPTSCVSVAGVFGEWRNDLVTPPILLKVRRVD